MRAVLLSLAAGAFGAGATAAPNYLSYADFRGKGPYTVTYDNRSISVGGHRTLFHSAGIHYPRFTVGQWDDVFLKASAELARSHIARFVLRKGKALAFLAELGVALLIMRRVPLTVLLRLLSSKPVTNTFARCPPLVCRPRMMATTWFVQQRSACTPISRSACHEW